MSHSPEYYDGLATQLRETTEAITTRRCAEGQHLPTLARVRLSCDVAMVVTMVCLWCGAFLEDLPL